MFGRLQQDSTRDMFTRHQERGGWCGSSERGWSQQLEEWDNIPPSQTSSTPSCSQEASQRPPALTTLRPPPVWSQGSSDGRTGRSGATAEGGGSWGGSGHANAPPYFDVRDLNLARDIRFGLHTILSVMREVPEVVREVGRNVGKISREPEITRTLITDTTQQLSTLITTLQGDMAALPSHPHTIQEEQMRKFLEEIEGWKIQEEAKRQEEVERVRRETEEQVERVRMEILQQMERMRDETEIVREKAAHMVEKVRDETIQEVVVRIQKEMVLGVKKMQEQTVTNSKLEEVVGKLQCDVTQLSQTLSQQTQELTAALHLHLRTPPPPPPPSQEYLHTIENRMDQMEMNMKKLDGSLSTFPTILLSKITQVMREMFQQYHPSITPTVSPTYSTAFPHHRPVQLLHEGLCQVSPVAQVSPIAQVTPRTTTVPPLCSTQHQAPLPPTTQPQVINSVSTTAAARIESGPCSFIPPLPLPDFHLRPRFPCPSSQPAVRPDFQYITSKPTVLHSSGIQYSKPKSTVLNNSMTVKNQKEEDNFISHPAKPPPQQHIDKAAWTSSQKMECVEGEESRHDNIFTVASPSNTSGAVVGGGTQHFTPELTHPSQKTDYDSSSSEESAVVVLPRSLQPSHPMPPHTASATTLVPTHNPSHNANTTLSHNYPHTASVSSATLVPTQNPATTTHSHTYPHTASTSSLTLVPTHAGTTSNSHPHSVIVHSATTNNNQPSHHTATNHTPATRFAATRIRTRTTYLTTSFAPVQSSNLDGTAEVAREIVVPLCNTHQYQQEHQLQQPHQQYQQQQQEKQHQQHGNNITIHSSNQLQQQQIKQHQLYQPQHQQQHGHSVALNSMHQLQQQQPQKPQHQIQRQYAKPGVPYLQIQQTTLGPQLTRATIAPNIRSTPARVSCVVSSRGGKDRGKRKGRGQDRKNVNPHTIILATGTSAVTSTCPPGTTSTCYYTSPMLPSAVRVLYNKQPVPTQLSVPSSHSQMVPKAVTTQLSIPSSQSLVAHSQSPMMSKTVPIQSSVTSSQPLVIRSQSQIFNPQAQVTYSSPVMAGRPPLVVVSTLAAGGKSMVAAGGGSVIAGRGVVVRGRRGTVVTRGGQESSAPVGEKGISSTTLNIMSTPMRHHNLLVPEVSWKRKNEDCKTGSGSSSVHTPVKRNKEESGMESGSSSVIRVQRFLTPLPASGIKLLFPKSNKRICV
ncbi:hypothetical protein Pmani_007474 [Petrolisthes manimaculis]|uniref:Uncharacterized protein n=1 Tax=Petrolisthes manimaculis TaxID=1843537 RepID=A0AAE1Q8H2_9EUCA|nr:hypothetical protein Pmani_007474 [Petrolisthes manimaculis]